MENAYNIIELIGMAFQAVMYSGIAYAAFRIVSIIRSN